MNQQNMNLVMDVSPWPEGQGFSGSGAWWEHVRALDEQKRLDNLMGVALLDEAVCEQLLHGRSDSLMNAFGLSEETQRRLRTVRAATLADLAQAISQPPYHEMLYTEEAS